MLFFKHSLSLLTLNLLLRAHYAFCEEDHTPFETEFRLMILTMYGREDPDGVEVTVEGQLGVESVDSHDNKNGVNIDWGIGSYLGSSRLTYMGWSHPNPNGRAVWIYRKGEDKESGMKVGSCVANDKGIEADNSAPSF